MNRHWSEGPREHRREVLRTYSPRVKLAVLFGGSAFLWLVPLGLWAAFK